MDIAVAELHKGFKVSTEMLDIKFHKISIRKIRIYAVMMTIYP